MDRYSRRKFLTAGLGVLATAAAGAFLYPLVRYLSPQRRDSASGKLTVPEGDVAEGNARFYQYDGETVVVVRKPGGTVTVLSAVCTHLGCIVQWRRDRGDFLCPCHGGTYTADGTVTGGPPPRPLPKIPFAERDGNIIIG